MIPFHPLPSYRGTLLRVGGFRRVGQVGNQVTWELDDNWLFDLRNEVVLTSWGRKGPTFAGYTVQELIEIAASPSEWVDNHGKIIR